jgi:hypothetical protein
MKHRERLPGVSPGREKSYRFSSDFQESVGFRSLRWIQRAGNHQEVGLEQFRVILQAEEPLTEFLVQGETFLIELAAVENGPPRQGPAHGHFKAAMQKWRQAIGIAGILCWLSFWT